MSDLDIPQETGTQRGRSTGSWAMLAILAAIVCIYVALMVGRHALGLFPGGERPGAHPAVGQPLRDLRLEPLTGTGEPVTLDDVRGQVVLLNFWGTWCPPCKVEFPHVAALSETLKDQPDFRLLSVSCGNGADPDLAGLKIATQAYLQQVHSRLTTYADQSAYTRRGVALALGDNRFAYPTTILLDRQGVIRGVWLGYEDSYPDQMRQLVDELLHPPVQ